MRSRLVVLGAVVALIACSRVTPANQAAAAPVENSKVVSDPAPQASMSPALKPVQHVDATRAMKYVRDLVNMGPRSIGSKGHQRAEDYIASHLRQAGAEVESDAFTAETPAGKLPMRNIIGKFAGKKDGVIVFASHYDTLYGRKDFVGANDGGSSTGLLLELANHLNARDGYSVWLVFFDGEEAIKQWTNTDSVYGSRHLAEKWEGDGTLKKVKALILLDMIGDADLNVDRDQGSTPWLEDLIGTAAGALGYQSYFFGRMLPSVGDDHDAFIQRGVPAADLIDFEYGYNNVFWHTPQDTMDKLSPRSLQVVGDVTLAGLKMLDQR